MKKNMLMKIATLAMAVAVTMVGGTASFLWGVGEPKLPSKLNK